MGLTFFLDIVYNILVLWCQHTLVNWQRLNSTFLTPLFTGSDVTTKIGRTVTGAREKLWLDALPAANNSFHLPEIPPLPLG